MRPKSKPIHKPEPSTELPEVKSMPPHQSTSHASQSSQPTQSSQPAQPGQHFGPPPAGHDTVQYQAGIGGPRTTPEPLSLYPSGQLEPPSDVPGQIPNPQIPSPPPFINVYSFSLLLKSDITQGNHIGNEVSVAAPTMQAAYQAVIAQYGSTIACLRGPCCKSVGVNKVLSDAAGA